MLLPSALPCDSSQAPPLTRLQSALFASPPASPPQLSTQTAFGNIFSTCRSLQSLLTHPAPPANTAQEEPITPPTSSHTQLPTPPMAHAQPPLKLRLRSRKTDTPPTLPDHGPARKRIVKRTAAVAQQPPRGLNKRRRAVDDDAGRDADSDMEQHEAQANLSSNGGRDREHDDAQQQEESSRPHTPKRSRIAPEVIPLGLERADYHSLHSSFSSSFGDMPSLSSSFSSAHEQDHDHHQTNNINNPAAGTDVVVEADGEMWSTEEDRILVELVLEKLKLTKSDWQDCARSLGKDRGSVGRRWKSLMVGGDVGLKRASQRRGRIHGTWR